MATPSPKAADRWILAGLAATFAVLIGGLGYLAFYQSRPGPMGASPATWPSDSAIARTVGLPMVVLFAHPRCGCTAATLSELRGLVSELRDRVSFDVRFMVPDNADRDWLDTPNWRSATSIDGVHVAPDPGGVEARRFGALTSGIALLYDADGLLRFTGGITPSRGHMGDNPGRTEILAIANHRPVDWPRTPVFGCGLNDPDPMGPSP